MAQQSWKMEVDTTGTGTFDGNGVRLATEDETLAYGRNLMSRWTLVQEYRAIPSDDPVNARFAQGALEHFA